MQDAIDSVGLQDVVIYCHLQERLKELRVQLDSLIGQVVARQKRTVSKRVICAFSSRSGLVFTFFVQSSHTEADSGSRRLYLVPDET